MRNSTHYSTVEQQTTELFTPLTFGSAKPIAVLPRQNRSTTRCQATKLLLIFFGIVSVLSLTLCGFNNLVVDYTTTTPISTTTTPISTTTTPISTTTTPISTTTTPISTTTTPISTTTTPISTTTTPISTTTTPISTTTTPISTTTTPISTTTTTTPISTTTTPISTTTTPISTTTTPEETTLLSDLDYDDTIIQLLQTPESLPVVITNKTIVINEVNNSLTVFD